MPGFNINTNAGNQPNARSELRRSHRWIFTAGFLAPGEYAYLKTAQRPKLSIEPVEMHHNQEVAYFAGKQKWEPLSLEFYDAQNNPDISQRIHDWLVGGSGSVLDAFDGGSTVSVASPATYKLTTVELSMVDGAGAATESWQLLNSWPHEFNWNDLKYEESNIATVSIILRFDRAIKIL